MKKLISAILAAVLSFSCVNAAVFSNDDENIINTSELAEYQQNAENVQENQEESQETPEDTEPESSEEAESISTDQPENEVSADTDEYDENTDADTTTSENSDFCPERNYIEYSQIITGNEKYLQMLDSYYNSISDTAETINDILSPYFTDEEIVAIQEQNIDSESLYKLLAWYLESEQLTSDEKESIKGLILENYSITESLNAFMRYQDKKEAGTISESDTINIESIESCILTDEQEIDYDSYSAVSLMSSNDENIYASQIVEPKYYIKQNANTYIDMKSGNLRYVRTDVNIPLQTGYLTLELMYNLSDAKAAGYFYDDVDLGAYGNVPLLEAPLGVGWRFNLTRKEQNVVYLKDGRSFITYGNNMMNQYYNDIDFGYDSNEKAYYVSYLDGSKEYINKTTGLMYKSIDKYGIVTNYSYASQSVTGTQFRYSSLSQVSTQGKTVNITYYDDKVVIALPGGDTVSYIKESRTVDYGALCNKNWSVTRGYLTEVLLNRNGAEQLDAFFFYHDFEMSTYMGPMNGGISGTDYYVFSALWEIDDNLGYYDHYTYEVEPNNFNEGGLKTWNLTVSEKYKHGNRLYSTIEYLDNSNNQSTFNRKNTKCVETFANGKTVTYEYDDEYTTITTKENSVIKNKETTLFSSNYEHIPESCEYIEYNSNGDYISKKHVYEYNNKDQIINDELFIDSISDTEYIYTYNNKNLISEKNIYRNDQSISKESFLYTVYGDLSEYEVTDNNQYNYVNYSYDGYERIYKKDINGLGLGSGYVEYYQYSGGNCLPTMIYSTDEDGQIISKTEYTYDSDTGLILTKKDGKGNVTSYTYDSKGNIIKELLPNGDEINITHTSYATDDYPAHSTIVTYDNGYSLQYIYDVSRKISEVSEKEDENSDFSVIQSATYDVYGNLTSETDAEGNTVTITNDIFGRQKSVTYPAVSGTASEPVRAYYYDVFFDGTEKCSAVLVVNQSNQASISYYNLRGLNYKNAVIKNMSSLSNVNWENITQLPSNAQLVVTQTNTYDNRDRLIQTLDGENRPTVYTYDVVGNITSTVMGNSSDTQLAVSYTYNSNGNVLSVNQAGHITTNEYDLAGRLVKTTDPMGFTEEYEYDLCGNVTRAKDKNGVYTNNTYDSLNRLIGISKNNTSITYTYDSMNNLLTSADSSGTITYEYNADGTLASKEYPNGKTIYYTSYDDNKNLLSMTDYYGNITNYTYNSRNMIASIGEKYNGTTVFKTTSYTYNDDGSLNKVNIPNGVTTNYSYDYAGRVSSIQNIGSSQNEYTSHTYTYDNSGNVATRTDVIDGDETISYEYNYDSVNRLSREWSPGVRQLYYTYDQHNNLISAVYDGDTFFTYDANNRLIAVEDQWTSGETSNGEQMADWYIDYTYDNNGNLLSSEKYSDDYESNEKTYTYNTWGQLIGYTDSLGETAAYTYYSDGLRKSKAVGDNITTYYYNGGDVINEGRNGTAFATNVMGVDGIISRQQSGAVSYYLKNAHGDIVYTLNDSRTTTATYKYSAWGETMDEYDSNTSSPNPIKYSGEYEDSESGMIYLRGRYYDPELRRFITEDPAKDGLNWYAYCGNNPVMRVDPTGFSYDEVINALDAIYNAKNTMNHTTPGSTSYNNALETAKSNKEIIRNSDVYIENWGGLTEILSGIVDGISNSLETINNTKNIVEKAKEKSQFENLTDDVLFVAAISAVIAPSVKTGLSVFSSTTIGGINFTSTAAERMANPARYVPVSILKMAIEYGTQSPDPQGSNAIMYTIQMYRNNVEYTLEVLFDKVSNTIYHFMYYH